MAEKRPSLNVLSGPLAGQKFVLEDAVDNILIGSDPSCGFVLDTPGVSPIHARLWVDLNGATVYDTNSPNGVYVNDDRVVKEAPVRNGDILWLGPPGAEGSVLIQCILPPPSAPAAEGASAEAAAAPARSPEGTAPIDSGSTMAFGMPAYLPDEAGLEDAPPAAADEASDVDSTVVLASPDVMGHPRDRATSAPPPPPVRDNSSDATALLDVSDGLEIVDETVAMPPPIPARPAPAPPAPPVAAATEPVAHGGFPDFEVEPTVAMPPPLPPRAATPPPSAEPAEPVFEEDIEPTVVDVPAPTVARSARPSAPAAPVEEDDAATVMFRHDTPPPPAPKPAAPPPAPPTPARTATPAAPTPAAPAAKPAAPAAKPAAPAAKPAAAGARPAAEARPAAAKAPAAARPAAPPPRARAERPAAPAAAPAPPRGGGGSKVPLIAGAGALVVALGIAAWWFTRTPEAAPTAEASPVAPPVAEATPPPVAAGPPVTEAAPPETQAPAPVAEATPIPESVTVVRSPVPSPRVAAATPPPVATPRPGATPPGQRPATPPPAANPAQQTAAAVANLMAQARTASDARNYDAAVSMYDEVLKLDPGHGPATAGRTAAINARTASRKTFAPGRTVVSTEQKAKGGLSGFDGADVVQKSADFSGRLEFAMNPPTVKPGEPYRLTVALVNDGKKSIKISGMTYTITVNGNKTGNPVMPKVREVGPSQRVVLEELPGVFPEATSWVAEVLVTANKGDSLKNQLTWK
jgi:hypothetical protein